MSKQDEEQKNGKEELIDIVSLCSDYFRVFRKMWIQASYTKYLWFLPAAL